jgi:hypothetical protein
MAPSVKAAARSFALRWRFRWLPASRFTPNAFALDAKNPDSDSNT